MKHWNSAAARRIQAKGQHEDVSIAIRGIAEELLRSCATPPTDLEAIAHALGATIATESIFGSGELRKTGAGYQIVTSKDISPERQRFTIAHEIAHLVIEGTGARPPRRGKELERLCDRLAVELLLPASAFVRVLPELPTIGDIFGLARTFQASLTATAQRVAELSNTTVLEIHRRQITWHRGTLDPLPLLRDNAFQQVMQKAELGQSGNDEFYFDAGGSLKRVHVEFQALGNVQKALFLLRPLRMRPPLSQSA